MKCGAMVQQKKVIALQQDGGRSELISEMILADNGG
jgi:hypothetical protein